MDLATLVARLPFESRRTRWLLGAAGCVLVAVIVVTATLQHPARSNLFATALTSEQLAEVQQRLAAWNVAFTTTADNVVVSNRERNAVLLRLSLAGVPHAHISSSGELLTKLGALTPQAVIDEQTRDGLAGDIALALRGIENIQDARVIVAPGKAGYYADDVARDASASVRISLVPGTRLASDTVRGIRAFVAAAVPALDARNVTIVDDRGVALGDARSIDEAGDLQGSLQSALDQAVGIGATIVRVHLEYDTRTFVSHDTKRGALTPISIAESREDERYSADGKRYVRGSVQLERGSDTHELTATSTAPRIAHIAAAVFVDASAIADLSQIRSLASATLGIDARRGDSLQVGPLTFKHGTAARTDGVHMAWAMAGDLFPTAIVCITACVALRWSLPSVAAPLRALAERMSAAKTAAAVHGVPPANVRAALAGEPAHTAAAIISSLPTATAAAVLEMYPPEDRAAIVRRMQRPVSSLLPDPQEVFARA